MTAMQLAQTMTAEEFIALPVPEHGRPWNLGGDALASPLLPGFAFGLSELFDE